MSPETRQRIESLQQIVAIAMVVLMLIAFFFKVVFI